MSRAEHTIAIRRPAGVVFPYLTDPDKSPLWQPSVVEVRRLADGTELRFAYQMDAAGYFRVGGASPSRG